MDDDEPSPPSAMDPPDARDDLTLSMFGEPETAPEAPRRGSGSGSGSYLVLARKYRPRRFEDLVGQEAMVRTLSNAFAADRIAHAYMLTGVRGVGKTTTARLIARALNYRTAEVDRPSIVLDPEGEHCAAITAGAHPDVFELDAASRTGVDAMRELLDGVRYGPLSARYKVYVIDEVHMLSASAFNALLKTLEEPPPHAKFIFATTEIRKVPVTILSRCQRFDLRRVPVERLVEHLAANCASEGAVVAREGLELIARAAEGSVRDAQSLLDQAIVQDQGGGVTAAQVRDMLGLADRGRTLDALEAVLKGDARRALTEFAAQYERGADPGLFLRDLMDATHEASKLAAVGAGWTPPGPADQIARLRGFAESAGAAALSRLWQLLLRGFEEAARAPDPVQAAEMCLLRVCAAQSLPPPEELARLLAAGEGSAPVATGQAAPEPVARPAPASASGASAPAPANAQAFHTLDQALAALEAEREIVLVTELERFARPVRFEDGFFSFEPLPGGAPDLARRAREALSRLAGRPWTVETARGGGETMKERAERLAREARAQAGDHPLVAEALAAFPGATIVAVRGPGANAGDGEEAPPETPSGVVQVDFSTRRAAH
jgi:DNA polymerase-3 subunit gamma/tau